MQEPVEPGSGTTHSCQGISRMRAFGRDPFAEGIMASDHARRTNRSNTWPHRPAWHHRRQKPLPTGRRPHMARGPNARRRLVDRELPCDRLSRGHQESLPLAGRKSYQCLPSGFMQSRTIELKPLPYQWLMIANTRCIYRALMNQKWPPGRSLIQINIEIPRVRQS
jgi:hypothetical protein